MGKRKNWKKVQFIVPDLALEVTRRCNMACEHCLRGEAQNCDIDFKVINKATKFITPLSVVFTGGEPSLNTMAIDYYFKRCEVNDNVPESFYVVTNGLDKIYGIYGQNLIVPAYNSYNLNENGSIVLSPGFSYLFEIIPVNNNSVSNFAVSFSWWEEILTSYYK